MKKIIVLLLILLCATGYAEEDCYELPEPPAGLTERESEIYLDGYRAGFYAAQHSVIDERHPENDVEHYVINTNSGKFHYPSCNGVQSMNQRNRKDFYGTREEAIANGYEPCGMCDP